MRKIFAVVFKLTFFRNDGDFVSSRKIGKIASRNLMNNSLFGSPSWIRNKDVTIAANLPSDSLPFRKHVINCSSKVSVLIINRKFIWYIRRRFDCLPIRD